MRIKPVQINVNLPFGIGGVSFIADESQQRAAWNLYVELVSRVTVQALDENQGLMREALNSLYKIFEITRKILKEAGPEVADGDQSFGPIALAVLNDGLRPFTSKWHPLLKDYEELRPEGVGTLEHEQNWEHYQEMRDELLALQDGMGTYVDILAKISGAKK